MKTILLLLTIICGPFVMAYEPPHPAADIRVIREMWRDEARQRDLPVKIVLPEGRGPFPVVIFSHGLGGSRETCEYLGKCWAGCGYATVYLQHPGSDESVWKNVPPSERMQALVAAVQDVSQAVNRAADVSFALDELTRRNADPASALHGRLDLARIGLSGHSFGAWTTLAVAGQSMGPKSLADPRITAGIAMSAPAPRLPASRQSLGRITIPILHMTGTLDDSPIRDTKASERREPFDAMRSPGTGLIIFNGADHMTFADPLDGSRRWRATNAEKNAEFQRLICLASTAFWDAWLKNDKAAQRWLTDGSLKRTLVGEAALEWKTP